MRPPWSAASPLTAHCKGPHGSLVQHLILCLMGRCKLVVQISQDMKWAHMRACTQLLSAAVGQCELIVQISQQMKWAYGRVLSMRAFRLLWASLVSSARPCHGICIAGRCGHIGLQLSPLTIHCEGPHGSLVQHLILCLMGQCKPVVQISQYMKWAHASACA